MTKQQPKTPADLTPGEQYDRAIAIETTGIDPLSRKGRKGGKDADKPRRRRDGSGELLRELSKEDPDFWRGL
jgi:hypothetical protein